MICLIKDGSIIHGPANWNLQNVMESLYPHGFDRSQGNLYRMSDMQTPLMPMPDVEPTARLDLGEGYAILPVVTIEEPAPEGQTLAGREPVILEGRVELRPVWVDIPPDPEPEKKVRYTPAEFMRLLTKDELDAVLAAESTDVDVKRMWAFIRAVGYVDMTDPLTETSLQILRAKNYLTTDERLQQVRDGVFQL